MTSRHVLHAMSETCLKTIENVIHRKFNGFDSECIIYFTRALIFTRASQLLHKFHIHRQTIEYPLSKIVLLSHA